MPWPYTTLSCARPSLTMLLMNTWGEGRGQAGEAGGQRTRSQGAARS